MMRDLQQIGLNSGGKSVTLAAPTDNQLALVEKLLGCPVPDAYILFLRHSNGGHPALDSLTVQGPGGDQQFGVSGFFHIAADDASTNDTADVVWRYHHRWPGARRQLLPIARDGGDNLFCLDLTPEGGGRVVLQRHDVKGFPLLPLASSFEAFVDMLEQNPDYT
jgi:SMI1 / KNR4 family (SUKH-1)